MPKETAKKVARVVIPGYKVAEKVAQSPAIQRAVAKVIQGVQGKRSPILRAAQNKQTIARRFPERRKPDVPVTYGMQPGRGAAAVPRPTEDFRGAKKKLKAAGAPKKSGGRGGGKTQHYVT